MSSSGAPSERLFVEPKTVLEPGALYTGDGGRVFCTAHAGMNARYTGRDISGQLVQRVTAADQREARRLGVTLTCETCRVERA